MSYNYKHNDRRCCRHYQRTSEAIGISSEYDPDSTNTCETIQNRSGDHNTTHKPKFPESNNEIGINKYHNTKCPVYVHNMKMQKRYSQNDAYQNPKHHRHQTQVYSCNKWDYYNDRTHYMKNKFDKLTLSNEYAQKQNKSDCGKTSCPVHHACNTELKSAKRSIPKTETKVFNEDVINKLEESYWTKWKPQCKAHDCRAHDGEKMIRTEDDYMKRKTSCDSERNLPLRCPDCFKCVPNDNDVKCLHKRAATKESKSSDFVKSELDGNESPIEANYSTERNESNVNVCCDCPKSCPGKVEMSSSELYYQKMIESDWKQSGVEQSNNNKFQVKARTSVMTAKQKKLDKYAAYATDKEDEHDINKERNKREKSRTQDCENQTCPYVVADKQKKLDKYAAYATDTEDEHEIDEEGNKREKSRTQDCENQTCPYVVADKQKKLDKNAAYLTDKEDEHAFDKEGNKREKSRSQECENQTCPYVVADKQKKLNKNSAYLTDKEDEHAFDKEGNKREKSRSQECEIQTCPYVVAAKQKQLDKNIPKTKDNTNEYKFYTKVEKSFPLKSELPTCPYVTKRKLNQKKSESDTSGSCNNPRCYQLNTKYETNVSLEGQDVEEQLKITQYSNRLLAKSVQNRGVNAEETIKNGKYDKIIDSADPIQQFSNNAIGDSKLPDKAKSVANQNTTAESPMIPLAPEGAEFPVMLKHTDSFILNSIKQNSSEGKPHYKQPTTIKLSNTARVKGHSYPLKPILKKEKPQVQRKALHSPKKPAAKSLKPAYKKK